MEYGVIINNDNSRPELCPTFGHCPQGLFFSKICFIKIIGVGLQTYG